MTRLVAFVGKAESGKSTAARVLLDEYDYKLCSFAYPLKSMLLALGLSHEQVYGSLKEQPSFLLGGKSARWAMQTLGIEWGRDLIHPDIWINAWKQAAASHLMQNVSNKVVVDDCRFPNEAETIIKLGGKIFSINRRDLGTIKTKDHASEDSLSIDLIDTQISNIDNLENFKDFIKFLFKPKEEENAQT